MPTEAKKAGNARHVAKLDLIKIQPYKEEGAAIRAAAANQGQSVQGFVLQAVREHMERGDGGSSGTLPPISASGAGGGETPPPYAETASPSESPVNWPTIAFTGGAVSLPSDAVKRAQDAANAAGEALPDFMRRAIMETAKRDAAPMSESPLSPDVLETARTAAQAAGESLEAFLSRAVRAQAVRDETERTNAAKASKRPQPVLSSQKKALSGVAFDNPAIAEIAPYLCELLNKGKRAAKDKGRVTVSMLTESYIRETLEAGYTLEEIKAAAEKGAQDGYAGGWYGLLEYCRKLYGRRYPNR